MKNLLTFVLLTLFAIGCSSEAGTTDSQAGTETPATTANAGKVWHYTCPNNCANSGSDTQGNCPVCAGALAHNQAWHNLPENQATPTPTDPDQLSPIITTDGQVTTTTIDPATPALKEPAQNANGVWHYTCGNGCAGGAGTQGNCASCGSPLAHNAAYHQ